MLKTSPALFINILFTYGQWIRISSTNYNMNRCWTRRILLFSMINGEFQFSDYLLTPCRILLSTQKICSQPTLSKYTKNDSTRPTESRLHRSQRWPLASHICEACCLSNRFPCIFIPTYGPPEWSLSACFRFCRAQEAVHYWALSKLDPKEPQRISTQSVCIC